MSARSNSKYTVRTYKEGSLVKEAVLTEGQQLYFKDGGVVIKDGKLYYPKDNRDRLMNIYGPRGYKK